MGLLSGLTGKHKKNGKKQPDRDPLPSEKQVRPISSYLDENISIVTEIFGEDAVTLRLKIGGEVQAGIAYIRGLVDNNTINQHILSHLLNNSAGEKPHPRYTLKNIIGSGLLTVANVKETDRLEQVIDGMLNGDTVLFAEGETIALLLGTKGYEKRAIDRPETEITVRGSAEAFIEDLDTNISLVRRRLRIPDLRFESYVIGRLSRTRVRLAYIEGVINPKIIEEARLRIQRIDVDYLFDAAEVGEFIEDNPMSIWPQIRLTERPDTLVANMIEGRFAVFVDGVPFVLLAPVLFWQNLQTLDDYVEKPLVGTFFRLIRHGAFYVSLLATPIYVALVTFHQSIIPPLLALRIAGGRETVPFPSIIETLLLNLAIDFLREAGVRLPRAIGSAVGILGAVVIGQAAVAAGLVSPALIIVVSIAAISTFAIPAVSLSNATRVANYLLILLAGTLGLFGVVLGMVYFLWGIVSMRSFGIPLFYPMAPGELYGLKDIFIRAPAWTLRRRPSLLAPDNQVRMGESAVKPGPKHRGGERDK